MRYYGSILRPTELHHEEMRRRRQLHYVAALLGAFVGYFVASKFWEWASSALLVSLLAR